MTADSNYPETAITEIPTPGSRPPYIEFNDVQVRYTPHVHGLRGVNLLIRRGDFVFLVGKTGAGKSTLLKLLTREVKHDAGNVRFHGRDLSLVRDNDVPALRREMGIVPQDFALLPRKRVWENVAYAMRAVGNSRRTVRRRVPEILERVNVGHRADAFPHELSGGEQQRVAIGRALINNPPLILADEPTGNLDPQHSWEIMELLRSLNARGATVIVATHDMAVVDRMARRIVTLEGGHIIHDTAPDGIIIPVPHQHELELFDRPLASRIFAGAELSSDEQMTESAETEAAEPIVLDSIILEPVSFDPPQIESPLFEEPPEAIEEPSETYHETPEAPPDHLAEAEVEPTPIPAAFAPAAIHGDPPTPKSEPEPAKPAIQHSLSGTINLKGFKLSKTPPEGFEPPADDPGVPEPPAEAIETKPKATRRSKVEAKSETETQGVNQDDV